MKESTCIICGGVFPLGELTEFDEHLFCRGCLNEQTVLCSDCGERIYRSQNEGNSSIPLCYSCHEEDYTYCERCGRLIRRDNACYFDDDDNAYCESCYDAENDRAIKEYNYKPTPIFYGGGKRYFGVELEIDGAGEDCDSAESIMNVANYNSEHIYCKHDGSLEEGFEIVTYPMSLEYHLEEMPWERIVDKARRLGYTSHQAETCGLHVHVSRDALGDTSEAQDATIGRILYFVERNWSELLISSRRTEYQLSRWAARYGYKDNPSEMLEHAKKGNCNRYTCVNLTNDKTIEFRIFRGTLKLNTIFATLQLVNHICDVAISFSDESMRRLSWSEFVSHIEEEALIRYLKERRIYLNEPVESEEEI